GQVVGEEHDVDAGEGRRPVDHPAGDPLIIVENGETRHGSACHGRGWQSRPVHTMTGRPIPGRLVSEGDRPMVRAILQTGNGTFELRRRGHGDDARHPAAVSTGPDAAGDEREAREAVTMTSPCPSPTSATPI